VSALDSSISSADNLAQPSAKRIFLRVRQAFLATLALVVVVLTAAFVWLFVLDLPATRGSLHLTGLRAPVQVERDALGIPHFSAQSLDDLYLAQGYVTAQDRLWQMELLRRVARGEVSEIAGARALPLDVDSRTLGMRQAADAAVVQLPADQRRWITAYTAGVNAFISTHSLGLPVEYKLLQLKPRPWTESDSLVIGLHMFRNLTTTWRDELLKTALLQRVGPQRTADLLPTRTDQDEPPGDTQERQPLAQSASRIHESSRPGSPAEPPTMFGTLLSWSPDPWFPSLFSNNEEGTSGSNNWVVGPSHTASGRAMLANDPHLEFSVPGIWYAVQLNAPGMDVAGVSLPGLPAVIIGHNEKIAWGMTNLGADVQDLYLETFDPHNPRRYLVDGEWKDAQVRQETIHVKGQRDREINVTVTRHGPLMVNRPGESYALRWVATEPGVWKFPFTRINAATNWEQFTTALREYPGPAQNFVYADAAGDIGYYGAGLIPIRPRGDGSVPLRGDDTANDWKGYIPFEQLPHVYNPPDGVIATANARVVPDNYPYPVATSWESPDRVDRINELLRKLIADKHLITPGDFRRIQVDIYAGHHRMIAQAVAAAVAVELKDRPNPRLAQAAEALRRWDGVASADSYATSLAHFTREDLKQRLLRPVLGDLYARYNWHMQTVFLENVLTHRPTDWLPPGPEGAPAGYDQLLTDCLSNAMTVLEKRFGTPKMEEWRWGKVMEISFVHPIGNALPVLRHLFNLGPFEQGGTGYTVKQTTHTLGPSMRMVVDFGDLEKTTLTLTTGESGHPLSSHYRDQFPKWRSGEGVLFSFTGSAAGRDRLVLQP
jgi:penicillin amidase